MKKTRAAALVAIAGLTGGIGVGARPAQAAPLATGMVAISAHIVDIDSPDADDICDRSGTFLRQADLGAAAGKAFTVVSTMKCDEITVRLTTNAFTFGDGISLFYRTSVDVFDRNCPIFSSCKDRLMAHVNDFTTTVSFGVPSAFDVTANNPSSERVSMRVDFAVFP